MPRNIWTEEEEKKLKVVYYSGSDDYEKHFPCRSRESVLDKIQKMKLTPPPGWITREGFARASGTSTKAVSYWACKGKLKYALFGGRKYYRKEDALAFSQRNSTCFEDNEPIISLRQACKELGFAYRTIYDKKRFINHWKQSGDNYIYRELFDVIVKEIEEKGFVDWKNINDKSIFPRMDDKRKAHAMRSFYNLVVDVFKKEVEYYKEDFVMDCALIVQYDYPKEFWYSTRTMGTYFHLDRESIEKRHKELAAISKQKPNLYRVFLQPVLHEGITKYEYKAELV